MVLVALDLARDVERGVLDRLAVGACRQRGQRIGELRQRLPLDLVRRAVDLGRLHEIVEVADRILGEPVELGMRLQASRPSRSAR